MIRKTGETQVDNTHYKFQTYSSERRFISYYHQVKNVFRFIELDGARRILVIGKGDGVVPKILEAYSELFGLDLVIDTFDFAADLNPTYVGDIVEINTIVQEKYDVVVCCQMLEHIPFAQALDAMKHIRNITKFAVISLPYKAFTIRGSLKVPVLPEFDFCIKIPIIRKKGMVDERHYWELGCSISVSDYKQKLEEVGYTVVDSYILKKHGNHYFLVLK